MNARRVRQTIFDPQESNLRRGYPADTAWGAEPENWGMLTLSRTASSQRRVPAGCDYRDYANLRDARKATLAATPEWALDVMRLLELARQSSDERRTISLPVTNPLEQPELRQYREALAYNQNVTEEERCRGFGR
jgi:hypothetical protein